MMGSRRSPLTENCDDDDFVRPDGVPYTTRHNRPSDRPEVFQVVFPAASMKLNSAFSLNKVHAVLSTFVGEKRDLVTSIGFVVLRPDLMVPFAESDVNLVLGLPCTDLQHGRKFSESSAHDAVKATLGITRNSEISMDYVESLLTRDYGEKMSTKEKNAFKVAAVIYIDAHMLAPRTSPAKVNHQIFGYLADPSAIHEVNWAAYVLNVVKETSIKVKQSSLDARKCVSLDCCLILLKVFYLDHLAVSAFNASKVVFPRLSDYPYLKMKSIISMDQHASKDGKFFLFGRVQVRPADEVVYAWGTAKIEVKSSDHFSVKEEVPETVLNKIDEFKAGIQACKTAIVDQLDSLVSDLDEFVSKIYSSGCSCAMSDNHWSTYALTCASMPGNLSDNESTPASFVIGNGRGRTPVYVPSCSADKMISGNRSNGAFGQSAAAGTILGYSDGPAFDKSGISTSDWKCKGSTVSPLNLFSA